MGASGTAHDPEPRSRLRTGEDKGGPLHQLQPTQASIFTKTIVSTTASILGESLRLYNKGRQCFLETPASDSSALIHVKCDLFRNRSYIRLKLGQYEGTITDAIESLSDQTTDELKELDAKAYSRVIQDQNAKFDHCPTTFEVLLPQLYHTAQPYRTSFSTTFLNIAPPLLFNQCSLEWFSGEDTVHIDEIEKFVTVHLWPAGARRMLVIQRGWFEPSLEHRFCTV